MEYRKLGRTGLKVSALCLGTMTMGWTSTKEDSFAVLDTFVEAGGNFLDTADIYSFWAEGNPGGVAEAWVGEWLRQRDVPRHHGRRRYLGGDIPPAFSASPLRAPHLGGR